MTTETTTPKVELPLWAKILVGLFGFGLVSACGLIGLIGYVSGQITNPAYIHSVTRAMVKIDQLPEGFRYDKGVEFPGAQLVMIVHEKDGTTFSVTTVPNPKELNAQGFVDQLKTSRAVGGDLEVKDAGKLDVGGKEFHYAVGKASMTPTHDVGQMRGALILDNKRAFMVIGTTPEGEYNMDATRKLLASIKGF